MMSGKNLMIVDDDLTMALNLEELLTAGGYQVVGTAQSGEAALEIARKHRPSLAIMDIKLGKGMDGIETAISLREAFDIPSIFITGYDERDLLDRAKQCRPFGYILKPLDERQILIDIEMALFAIGSGTRPSDVDQNSFPAGLSSKYADLTPMELRIAYQISQGRTSKEISEIFSISETTVQWHRKNIRKKLNLTNTDQNLTINLRF